MEIKRGSVYWVNLDPTKGSEIKKERPCVAVGVDPVNEARRTVVIIPLSRSAKPRPPLVISVICGHESAVAVIDQIRAVDKARISNKMCDLTSDEMQAIENGMRVILGL